MLVKTYLNDGPGRFFEYQPGDRLHVGPEVIVPDPAPSQHPLHGIVTPTPEAAEHSALDKVWAVGNRMSTAWVRWAGTAAPEWPSFVRSLSAGDVLVIGETAWAVDHIGFKVLDGADLARSLGPDAVESDRGSFGAPARSAREAGL